ncbi:MULTISPECIES: stage V sporulation protein K [Bacillaceae]|uniref:Stage V sporulation protein K n=2 Tax=Bacillaceae TaxID=186817 RepID=A0A109MYB1_9BACI|nr:MULTISPECIES: stage V sporulation protein K [Bacillaceae]KWW18871.1 stage V sporulation protein K [Peribacillus simplex]PJN91570.1 stage V sporulation protein K [Bacillus sp. mrc49]
MEQPIRMKNNGQINIVFNAENRKTLQKDLPIKEILVQEIPHQHAALREIEEELKSLVGMEEMKRMIKEIYAWIYINKQREAKGMKTGRQALHMMFKGNPGTGKTTVARLIGKLFQKMNVLSKGHLIEAERADLVGEYIGHTAQKTRDLIKKAIGGILFIDEAYSLGRGGEKDFGKEAIDTLVKHMEDRQHEFILILAGYSREMDYFLSLNPGLHSRFPLVVDFPDYTIDQLMEIADRMLQEREYIMNREAERKLKEHLIILRSYRSSISFSNGRYIRNVIEKSIRAQAMRLLLEDSFERTDLLTLTGQDLIFEDDEKE